MSSDGKGREGKVRLVYGRSARLGLFTFDVTGSVVGGAIVAPLLLLLLYYKYQFVCTAYGNGCCLVV